MIEQSHRPGYGASPNALRFGNINSLDEAKRLEHLASLKEGIDEAYDMGASLCILSGTRGSKRAGPISACQVTQELAHTGNPGQQSRAHEVFDYDIDKNRSSVPFRSPSAM
jgi:hypothetical protein